MKLQFKPEFEAKLKELGIRKQFVKNLKTPKWEEEDLNVLAQYKRTFINATTWNAFISYAFLWSATPEGSTFWNNIANK